MCVFPDPEMGPDDSVLLACSGQHPRAWVLTLEMLSLLSE